MRRGARLVALVGAALVLASAPPAAGQANGPRTFDKDAGPISSNRHARRRCPEVCAPPLTWNGQWRTTRRGVMSVCGCVEPPVPRVVPTGPPSPPADPAATSVVSENGKCLDVDLGQFDARRNPGRTQLWDCHGGPNQRWRLLGSTLLAGNGKCLDVDAGAHAERRNGARVQIWDCNGGPQQKWQVRGEEVVSSNGKCLDVVLGEFSDRRNGASLQLWDCNGGGQQRWAASFIARPAAAGEPPPTPSDASPERCQAIVQLWPSWSEMARWLDAQDNGELQADGVAWLLAEQGRLEPPTRAMARAALADRSQRVRARRVLLALSALDGGLRESRGQDNLGLSARIAALLSRMGDGCDRPGP